jgi:hypothetical protein
VTAELAERGEAEDDAARIDAMLRPLRSAA